MLFDSLGAEFAGGSRILAAKIHLLTQFIEWSFRVFKQLDARAAQLYRLEAPAEAIEASIKHETAKQLLSEVEDIISRRSFGMTLSAELESLFEKELRGPRIAFYKRNGYISLIFYNIMLIFDYYVVPDMELFAIIYQMILATPIGIIVLKTVERSEKYFHFITSVYVAFVYLGIVIMYAGSHAPNSGYFFIALLACTFSANVALSVNFKSALILSTLMTVCSVAAIMMHGQPDVQVKYFLSMVIFIYTINTLVGNYRIESGARTAYILALRASLQAHLLEASNHQLAILAERDGLTGVKNRRSFDTHLEKVWGASLERQSLALVLIDIDHFKQLNDSYGHQVGDLCLRVVAQSLADLAQSPCSFLARFGGEEFALLIENADTEVAVAFAENLRIAIAKLQFELQKGCTPLSLTISLGCASIVPVTAMQPYELVAAADAALYQAKRNGRNRIEANALKANQFDKKFGERGGFANAG